MASIPEKEKWIVQRLAISGDLRDSETHMGSNVLAAKVIKAAGGSEQVANLTGKEVKVKMPASFFQTISENLYLVVSDFSKDVEIQMGPEAAGVVNIEFWTGANESVRRHHVAHLEEPLRLTLPLPHEPNLACAYFKVGEGWSTEGVTTVDASASGSLECYTTHLSIFGAIPKKEIKGVMAATTSQLALILLACLGGLFLYLLAVAACLDARRASTSVWSRESFLVPREQHSLVRLSDTTKFRGALAVAVGATAESLSKSAKVVKEDLAFVLRFILGRQGEGRALSLATKLLLGDAIRAAAASLELGEDAARYVLTEQALPDEFAEQLAGLWSNLPEERATAALEAACLGGKQRTAKREDIWAGLYFIVNERINTALLCGRSLDSVARVFRAQNPLAYGYTFSMFTPRKMATLVHVAYFVTTLLVTTGFMEAAGPFNDAKAQLSGAIPLTIAAGILGRSVPWLLKSLRSREIRTVEYEGCPEWQLRLRAWAIQDNLVCGLGSLIVACGATVLALLAWKAADEQQLAFALALLVLALQEFLVIPALWALIPPFAGMCMLSIASKSKGTSKEELLKRMAPAFAPTARA